MYTLLQEIEVWYIIPALRREISKCLIKDHGLSYEKTGNILGISKAAISQYLKNKRASKIKLHDRAMIEVVKSCKRIMKGKNSAVSEIMSILDFIRTKNLHCEKCGRMVDGEYHDCTEIKIPGL